MLIHCLPESTTTTIHVGKFQGISTRTIFTITWRVILLLACMTSVTRECAFPADFWGNWVKSRDQVTFGVTRYELVNMTFAHDEIFTSTSFRCITATNNMKILITEFSPTESIAMCWELVYVNRNVYVLYELSGSLPTPQFPVGSKGFLGPAHEARANVEKVCSEMKNLSIFTTLTREGALYHELASSCPGSILATSQLCDVILGEMCDDETVVVDHTLVLSTAMGTLYCMGHVETERFTYLQLYKTGPEPSVICARLESYFDYVHLVYYVGDCTTEVSRHYSPVVLVHDPSC